jgi:hypothetical protein
MKKLLIPFLLLLAISLAGCAGETTMSATAKGLLATRVTAIGLADTANTLCVQGVLKQDQCDIARDSYAKAQITYKIGSEALLAWVATGIDGGSNAQSSLATLHSLLGNMQAVVGTYSGGK